MCTAALYEIKCVKKVLSLNQLFSTHFICSNKIFPFFVYPGDLVDYRITNVRDKFRDMITTSNGWALALTV